MNEEENNEKAEELSPEALALVDKMAEKVVADHARNKVLARRFNRKNRKAWERMNRKPRLDSIARGTEKIYNLLSGKGFVTDKELPK